MVARSGTAASNEKRKAAAKALRDVSWLRRRVGPAANWAASFNQT
jgi:hypothetical protein